MATTFQPCDASRLGLATDLVCRVHTLEGTTLDRRAVFMFLERVLRQGRLWLIEHNGTVAGYLLIELQPRNGFVWREANIRALYLRPAFRGSGIAQLARQLARVEVPGMGGILKWKQTYPEDVALVPASGTTYHPLTSMVAA
jgi:GNAT superfamily N-acetyltransferase